MHSGLVYDLRRSITSRTMLLAIVAIVSLSLALIPIIRAGQSPVSSVSPTNAIAMEYTDSVGFHFTIYSFDTFGQPVGDSTLSVNATDLGGSHSGSGTTNSSGYASFLVSATPSSTYLLSYNITYGGGLSQSGVIKHSNPLPPGSVHALGGALFAPVVDSSNSSKVDVLVVAESPTGGPPAGYQVYYGFSSSAGAGGPTSPQGMTYLGTLGAYHEAFVLPAIPAGTRSVSVGVSSPDGATFTGSTLGASSFGLRYFTVEPEQVFTKFTANVFSILVPIIAILLAFGSYGKDRTTGALDSVLVRPVSRRGLSLSRYGSLLIAMMVAIGLTIVMIDIISQSLLGASLNFGYSVATFASLTVEAAAFSGLTMLLSRMVRSPGTLIGITVGLWALLDIFWDIIVIGISTAMGQDIRSAGYAGISIQSELFNPSKFYVLVADYLNKLTISLIGGNNLPINPSAYGITPVVILAGGLIWTIVPFAIFMWLSIKRD